MGNLLGEVWFKIFPKENLSTRSSQWASIIPQFFSPLPSLTHYIMRTARSGISICITIKDRKKSHSLTRNLDLGRD